ncbi:helix-turn-helix transcriptional regulator [Cutibacterium avidum]|uniref:helix-turn-helix transcriptional regulator n=1 Tax=Cutibacterium avidum TaxID=33010 RepID=UPI00290C7801|nr:helix-turn-helix transcriptional regulator [Cutibacterium avidum]
MTADDIAAAKRFNATLGAVIRAQASFEGKSIAQLSRDTGIEYVTLGRYLRGQRDMPVSVIYRCALHLAVSVESLVHEAGQKMGWTTD